MSFPEPSNQSSPPASVEFAEMTEEEQLITRFSYSKDGFENYLVKITKPVKYTPSDRDATLSSLGILDVLPSEILDNILDFLDLQSLSQLSRVSIRGKNRVDSLLSLQTLFRHVPDALTALNRTGLAGYPSVATIHHVLRTSSCVGCGEFGPYLVLLTMERCCYRCLMGKPRFWVTSATRAKACFDFTDAQMAQLPTIKEPPPAAPWASRPGYRVSIKATRELGTAIGGSSEHLAQQIAQLELSNGSFPDDETYLRHLLMNARLDEIVENRRSPTSRDESCRNVYQVSGVVRFPFLAKDAGLEYGLWCRPCVLDHYQKHSPPGDPKNGETFRAKLFIMMTHARSKDAFLEHIRNCGALGAWLNQTT